MDWEGMGLEPLEGGFSGETFLAPGDEPLVVRIYRRDPDRAPVDAAILRLVRDILPVPEVDEVRLATPDTPAVLVTQRLTRGRPLDVLLDETDDADVEWEQLGQSLGRALATLSGVPFLRSGSFDGPELGVEPGSLPTDLAAWAELHRDTGRLSTWATADWNGLAALVDHAEDTLLPDGDRPGPVLVHSDFNTEESARRSADLGARRSGRLGVRACWLAICGHGESAPGSSASRASRRRSRKRSLTTPRLGETIQSGEGRAADLWALIELAGRPQSNTVTQLAERLLLAQARTGDLDAWPFDGHRISVRVARRPGQMPRIGSEREKPLS